MDRPTPHRLHPDSSLTRSALEFWGKQSTEAILVSLQTGKLRSRDVGKLELKPDGTVMNGNTRVKCLEERTFDLNKLWDLVEPPSTARQRFDDLFN